MKKLYREMYYLLIAPVKLIFCFLPFAGERRNRLAGINCKKFKYIMNRYSCSFMDFRTGIHFSVIDPTENMNIRFVIAFNGQYKYIVTPPPPPPNLFNNQHYISKSDINIRNVGTRNFNIIIVHRTLMGIFRAPARAPAREPPGGNSSFSFATYII
jgi:hypothetical protein